VWQSGEILYFAAVWWYLAEYLDPAGGGQAGFYWVAVGLRVAAQLYLGAVVVRDILMPEYDVVRDVRTRVRPTWWPPSEPGRLTLSGAPTTSGGSG
jgi:hypothetical protein